jgi:hypothetical protein
MVAPYAKILKTAAEHWHQESYTGYQSHRKHLRERLRHPTIRSKGCLSNRTALAMVFKLVAGAQKSWRGLDDHNQLPKLVLDATFNNGIESSPNRPTVNPQPPPPDRPRPSPKFGNSSRATARLFSSECLSVKNQQAQQTFSSLKSSGICDWERV